VGCAIAGADLSLIVPLNSMKGLVIFCHGSGSSRHSSRNKYVAELLNREGMGTLLLDLLTSDEEFIDNQTAELRFNIPFLAARVTEATQQLFKLKPQLQGQSFAFFGASTGSAAAITAASMLDKQLNLTASAIVSRGGRPDMVKKDILNNLKIPTQLIIGSRDTQVIDMNRAAYNEMKQLLPKEGKEMVIIPGATHLFPEPGTLDQAANAATAYFSKHLQGPAESAHAHTSKRTPSQA
jgi:putative phosphoribosyl transferase